MIQIHESKVANEVQLEFKFVTFFFFLPNYSYSPTQIAILIKM